MSKPKFHIGIIGAGLGGLAAAIAIANAGHRVTIVEQAPALGEVSSRLFSPLPTPLFWDKLMQWRDDETLTAAPHRSVLAFRSHPIRRGY